MLCWLQIGMLMLAAWYDEKHNDTGVSFAKYCKKTLESMHTDDGIYANADLITPDVVNGASGLCLPVVTRLQCCTQC